VPEIVGFRQNSQFNCTDRQPCPGNVRRRFVPAFGPNSIAGADHGKRNSTILARPATVRLWIIESIGRILAGEEFTYEDFGIQPSQGWEEIESKSAFISPERNPAHAAWIKLQQWVDDADIRAKDPRYGETRKEELRYLLEKIEADPAARQS